MFFLKEPSIKWQISNPLNHFIFLFRNYSLSHCGAGIRRASGAFEIRGTPRFALWRRNPPGLPAHSQSELRPPKGTRAAETGRRCGRAHAARGTRRDALSVARVGRAARADGAAESARGRVVRALSSNKHSSDDGAFICSDIFVQIYLFRYICSDMCSCDQNGRATDTAAVVHNRPVHLQTRPASARAPHFRECQS